LIKTLNEGLRLARGDFFCELASDDYFPVDSIEKRVRFMSEHPGCIAVFANGWRVDGNVISNVMFVDEKRKQMLAASDPIPAMIDGVLPVFSTGLIRMASLNQIGGFDENHYRYYEDLEMPILLSLAGTLCYLDEPVIYRREHASNVSTTTAHIRFEKINLYTKLLANPRLSAYRSNIRRKLSRSYLALGRILQHLPEELQRKGKSELKKSWKFIFSQPRLLFYLLKYAS
jgi:alpha-1,3-rhamnosyltransferase